MGSDNVLQDADKEALSRILGKLAWAVPITPAEDPEDATFHYPLTTAEAIALQQLLRSVVRSQA